MPNGNELAWCKIGKKACGNSKTDEHCICQHCVNCKKCPCKTKCDYDTCALQGCHYCWECFENLPFQIDEPPCLDRMV